ncbi:MAG: hypothetical protein M5U28_42565 [Sandaracinaceae bacterium]|nr:hypothetical protein [Sandaracinaceae bacterium]
MTRTWVALACTLSLACSTQPTRIRLSIVHEGSWELSALDVHLGDRVEQAPVLSELELWVPDDWAGTQVAVEVRGIRAGEAFATGRTTVVPRLGELVEAQVVLQRPACGGVVLRGGERMSR